MNADQFAWWLQGFAELSATPPTQEQWDSIREHLGLVFNKVTQPLPPEKAKQEQVKKLEDFFQKIPPTDGRPATPLNPSPMWPNYPPGGLPGYPFPNYPGATPVQWPYTPEKNKIIC